MEKLYTKISVIILLLILSAGSISAQTFEWAKKGIGESKKMKIDASGNIYVTGSFTNDINLLGISLSVLGGKDCYIAKYNPLGELLWVKKGGGLGNDEGLDICLDVNGNAYVTGTFSGTATFGNVTLIAKGFRDIFVLKCTPAGVFEWVHQAGGLSDDDCGNGIAIDQQGNICVTGIFGGLSFFESITLNASVGKTFLCKYNPAGVLLFAKQYNCIANALSIDATGNIILAGAKEENSKKYAYIAKLNAIGLLLWEFKENANDGSHIFSSCKSIYVDGIGNIFVTGDFNSKITLGGVTLVGINLGFSDIFCAKINSSGNLVFIKKFGGNGGSNTSEAITVDVNGEIYFTGKITGSVSALNGTILVQAFGNADIFICKLNVFGELEWVKNCGGTGYDQGNSLALDVKGNIFFCGAFSASAGFGIQILTVSVTGGIEACIGKLNPPAAQMAVKSFVLINADTDKDLGVIFDNDTIVLSSLPTQMLNIRANTNPTIVGSVILNYDNGIKTENTAPYSLFSDNNGDYKGVKLATGAHVLTGYPYSKTNGQGDRGESLTIHFFVKLGTNGGGNGGTGNALPIVNAGPDKTLVLPLDSTKLMGSASDSDGMIVSTLWTKISGPTATMNGTEMLTLSLNNLVEGVYKFRLTATDDQNATAYDEAVVTVIKNANQSVVSFTLINSDTDGDIQILHDKDTLNLDKLPTKNLNIRANTDPAIVGSIVFIYDGTKKNEGTAPYSLFGDNNGNYNPGVFTAGTHTLTATPYTGSGGGGIKGTGKSITIYVIEKPACGCTSCGCGFKLASDDNSLNTNNTEMFSAYPNPFSQNANIQFTITESDNVKLEVYDLTGNKLKTIYDGFADANQAMNFEFSGSNLNEGLYIVRLSGKNKVYYQNKLSYRK